MNHLETLIEEYKGELAWLEYTYHTFTDVAGNHIDTTDIVSAVQKQIVGINIKIHAAQTELSAHNGQFKAEKEFDKYENY